MSRGRGVEVLQSPDDGNFGIVNPQLFSPAQHELIDRSAHITIEKADPAYLNELSKFFGEGFVDTEHRGHADYVVASEGYFQSLGIPLLRGRLFNESDGPSAPHVAVVSESLVRQKWPKQTRSAKSSSLATWMATFVRSRL